MKPAPSSTRRYQALVQLLRAADIIWDASHAFFARWDLSPSQFNVLNVLDGHPSGLTQTELSRELIMHRSNVTGLVDRLEKRNLVKREDVDGDRRAYRVVLTGEGLALLRDVLPGYFDGVGQVCGHLSGPRAAHLIADLAQIARNAQQIAASMQEPEVAGRRNVRENQQERQKHPYDYACQRRSGCSARSGTAGRQQDTRS